MGVRLSSLRVYARGSEAKAIDKYLLAALAATTLIGACSCADDLPEEGNKYLWGTTIVDTVKVDTVSAQVRTVPQEVSNDLLHLYNETWDCILGNEYYSGGFSRKATPTVEEQIAFLTWCTSLESEDILYEWVCDSCWFTEEVAVLLGFHLEWQTDAGGYYIITKDFLY